MYQVNTVGFLFMCIGALTFVLGVFASIYFLCKFFNEILSDIKSDYKMFKDSTRTRLRNLEEEICKLKKENDNASCESGKSQESNS